MNTLIIEYLLLFNNQSILDGNISYTGKILCNLIESPAQLRNL